MKLTGLQIARYATALTLKEIRPALENLRVEASALVKRSKAQTK